MNEGGDDVLAEVVVRRLIRVGLERAHEHVGVEDVHAHRCEREVGRSRNRTALLRLLLEPGHALRLVHGDDAEATRLGLRHFDCGERHRGAALLMEPQHPRIVHFVDVIAGEHDQVPRTLARDRIQVLINRIRRSLIPVLAHALLRRQNLDEFSELLRDDAPPHPDVAVERERLVLRGDEHAAQTGVDAVAEDEIDDAVRSAEVHGRLGAFLRQRVQALADAACEHDDEAVVEQRRHAALSSGEGRRALALRRIRRRAAAGSTCRTRPAPRRGGSDLRSRSHRRRGARDAPARQAT